MKKSIPAALQNIIQKKAGRWIPLLLIFLLASCSLTPASLAPARTENTPAAQEYLIPVTRGTIFNTLSYVGNLRYNQSADMVWKTSGVIESVYVRTGDTVKKGDILAVLATDSLSSSVILSEKTMIEQQMNLENVMGSSSAKMQAYVNLNTKEIALKKAKLEQEALYYPRATREEMERAWDSYALAHLNFNYAKQDYDHLVASGEGWEGFEEAREINFFGHKIILGGDSRSGRERKFEEYVSTYNTLVSAYETYVWTSGRPSAVDYAVAEGNVEVAQMEYDKALQEYLTYENMPRLKDVSLAEAGLRNAENRYNQRFIIAAFTGTVTTVNAVEGYYVERGAAALRLDDKTRIFIPISVPELDISSIKNGAQVSITLDAIPQKTFSGHIYAISDSSDTSGTMTAFSVIVEVDEPDDRMLSGMTAEISLPANGKSDVRLIPNSAITYKDGKPYVTVVSSDGQRLNVEIQPGISSGDVSEVKSGTLHEGDRLAVSSITAEALVQLGLKPSDYLPETQDLPSFPASGKPERPRNE